MAERSEIHNEASASVVGNVFQAGAVHGDVVLLPRTSRRLGVDEAQTEFVLHLAGEVRAQSAQELRQWGIRDRDALAVRWHTAAEDLLDHWENIHDSPESLSLAGHFTAVRDTYKAIGSKRLVILGRAGAGKTVLAHRLILDLLDASEDPVPVLFSLSDWNPATELSHWLSQQLVRDFPFLEANDSTVGKRQADILVERGLILPVLDGFDEIPQEHHRVAIGEISSLDVPLVVTSRPDEYAQAARGVKAVGGAAAIELQDLSLDEAHRYLLRSTGRTRSMEWDAIFDHIQAQPNETATRNLAYVLTTPLMVTLVRAVHDGTRSHRPCDLLDIQRLPNTEAVEEHLLGSYVDTVYECGAGSRTSAERPSPGPDRARRWLRHLATHIKERNTHDLTWWNLPSTLPRKTRILVTSAIACLAGALAIVLGALAYGMQGFTQGMSNGFGAGMSEAAAAFAYALWGATTDGYNTWLTDRFTVGLVAGLVTGLVAALINELELSRGSAGREPERLRLDLRRRSRVRSSLINRKKRTSEFVSGLAVALAIALAVGVAFTNGSLNDPQRDLALKLGGGGVEGFVSSPAYPLVVGLAGGLAGGLVFGTVLGLVNVAVSFFGASYDPNATNPWTLLSRDRTVTLVRMTTTALVVGLAVGIIYDQNGISAGLIVGLMVGVLSGVIRLVLSAWGRWLLFTRLWLPLTGRLPWRPKLFLEDAYRRGVLRRSGAVYQFRHARLRDYLAVHCRT